MKKGDRIRVQPSGRESTVARIVTASGDLEQAIAGQSVTLTLADDGVARATADCNVGTGTYQIAGSDISFQITWQTAGCTQTGLARQFSTYLDYANAFQQQGDALVIYYNNSSGQMRFVAGQ